MWDEYAAGSLLDSGLEDYVSDYEVIETCKEVGENTWSDLSQETKDRVIRVLGRLFDEDLMIIDRYIPGPPWPFIARVAARLAEVERSRITADYMFYLSLTDKGRELASSPTELTAYMGQAPNKAEWLSLLHLAATDISRTPHRNKSESQRLVDLCESSVFVLRGLLTPEESNLRTSADNLEDLVVDELDWEATREAAREVLRVMADLGLGADPGGGAERA